MRMSDAETIMWAVEKDPALRSDFTNITVLDGRPDEARIRAKLDAALADIPRLAQRVVAPPLRLAPPEWRDDPTLDVDYHLRKVAAPAPGGTASSSTSPPRSRPPRSTARARCGSSRSSKGWKAGARPCSRRSTTP